MPVSYPPHLLSHGAYAIVMFFIVVEVFSLERVGSESRPLLHVEVIVFDVSFHAVFCHEAVIFLGTVARISHYCMDWPVVSA